MRIRWQLYREGVKFQPHVPSLGNICGILESVEALIIGLSDSNSSLGLGNIPYIDIITPLRMIELFRDRKHLSVFASLTASLLDLSSQIWTNKLDIVVRQDGRST